MQLSPGVPLRVFINNIAAAVIAMVYRHKNFWLTQVLYSDPNLFFEFDLICLHKK